MYTPEALAEWTAMQLLRHVPHAPVLRVLDPACGDGELLASIANVSRRPVELWGRDVDPVAISTAKKRIKTKGDFAVADSLLPATLRGLDWQPHAVITNPPWGRPDKVSRRHIQGSGYEMATGQFDLYEVFVERLIKTFPDVPMAFILPDSIFLPEHAKLRRFILKNSDICFLSRLGEGLFPGIHRGTVVLVLKRGSDKYRGVECFRLQPNGRRAFLTEGASLEAMRASDSYIVPLERFESNPNQEFTLDIRPDETAVDKMIANGGFDWDCWLSIGRGIEIGKNGQTLRCSLCGTHRAVPKKVAGQRTTCQACNIAFPPDSQLRRIVRPRKIGSVSSWNPIIVGEDVDRYRCEASREALPNVPGIRYKDPELMRKPKLLVRKTGVGLRAAVDESGSLTIQTVYHFVPKNGMPTSTLYYLAGILNSKVMLAFHLRWSGEFEWRSHPYVTPSTIKTLPVPNPFVGGIDMTDSANEIASLAKLRSNGGNVESEIERLVEDLYGFTRRECIWTREVIGSAQSLRGIVEMKNEKSRD